MASEASEEEPHEYELQVTYEAAEDLENLYEYKARIAGPAVAKTQQEQILKTISTIVAFPKLGTPAKNRGRSNRDEVLERFCQPAKASVAYTVEGFLVSIIAVRSDAMNDPWY